ncbi:Hsp20/alpha crystallin family protein [Planctomycetes bacterium K23_9]|uniref:Spore protein SP21 n=1 Tax=Stieleria marina TaxID=1930275 RepID=A0A517P181_9BACT|nr:Spore protein SP21 [Planctomycetes bacterium K23_9]
MRMVFPTNMTGRFLDDLASEMNTFVESVLGDETKDSPAGYAPRMDVVETETSFVAYLDLPGVAPDDVSIDMENDQVVVMGERVGKSEGEGTVHHRTERAHGTFRRAIALPKTVDKDAITADYEHGVLTIAMPKLVEEKKSRRIVISHGSGETKSDASTGE